MKAEELVQNQYFSVDTISHHLLGKYLGQEGANYKFELFDDDEATLDEYWLLDDVMVNAIVMPVKGKTESAH